MSETNKLPPPRDGHGKTRLAYAYLKKLAVTGEPYTDAGMAEVTGWKQDGTVDNYRSKHWKHWVKKGKDGVFTVSPSFESVSEGYFVERHMQPTQDPHSRYDRKVFTQVVDYEFLLPLTKERELTRALDALFYRDMLERIIEESGIDMFTPEFPEVIDMEPPSDVETIIQFVEEHFTGYSISHVSGRFRSKGIVPREAAGKMFSEGDRYLVDETTAVVRFVVPITRSVDIQLRQGDIPQGIIADEDTSEYWMDEVRQIRRTFFLLFVEAVIQTVNGEDEVWLLESGPENRLYVWEKRDPRADPGH